MLSVHQNDAMFFLLEMANLRKPRGKHKPHVLCCKMINCPFILLTLYNRHDRALCLFFLRGTNSFINLTYT